MANTHDEDVELGHQAPHHRRGSPHRGAQRTTRDKSSHSSEKGSGSRPSPRQGVALSIVKKSLRSHVDSDLTVGVGGRAARSSNDPHRTSGNTRRHRELQGHNDIDSDLTVGVDVGANTYTTTVTRSSISNSDPNVKRRVREIESRPRKQSGSGLAGDLTVGGGTPVASDLTVGGGRLPSKGELH